MNTAEWILVIILSVTLFVFLVVGIILLISLIKLSKEAKKIAIKGQDIAESANGVVNNVKGMTALGGTVEMFVNKYITPKLKEKPKNDKAEGSKKDGRKK